MSTILWRLTWNFETGRPNASRCLTYSIVWSRSSCAPAIAEMHATSRSFWKFCIW